MKIRIKQWQAAISMAAGIVFTMLFSADHYEYCMCGDGWGSPFAIIHPWHGNKFFIRLEQVPIYAPGIDIFNIVLNILVLALTAYLAISGFLWTARKMVSFKKTDAQDQLVR